jgi:predicted unusual protein kinase regulating ubiquinone biosynthesis (AarF/ABC1/UbiB family)
VQKPCVAEQIRHDLNTLKGLNSIFEKTGSPRSQEISSILKQYEDFLAAELDFNKERKNMYRFIDIMKEGSLPIKIPRPVDSLSSSTVLAMEYVPSMKINNVEALRARGVDTVNIANTLIQAFLYQIITAAYVHCDPHPGNIGVMEDGETLVLYDYGNVIDLSTNFKEELNQIVFAMYQKDADEFVEILAKLRILNLSTESEKLEAKSFFTYFFGYLETLDLSALRSSLTNGEFTGTLQSKLKLDSDFFSLFRVFSLLDGTCAKLDPDFSYIDALSPFADDLMFDMSFIDYRARKDFNKMRGYPTMLRSTDMNIGKVQTKVQQMENAQTQVKAILGIWIIVDRWNEPAVLATFAGVVFAWWLIQTRYKEK